MSRLLNLGSEYIMAEFYSDSEVLNAFNIVLPYLSDFFDNEASIAITDTEKYLKDQPCPSLSLNTAVGAPIPSGGAAYKALRDGHTVINVVPKEVYGTAFKSYAIPIKNRYGNLEGCVMVAKSLSRRDDLLNYSKHLSEALHQIADVTVNFAQKLQTIVEMNVEASHMIDEAQSNVNSTDKIFGFINQVTSQTNLLGINASIEATRAGADGKGFKVIAQEIRKLSETSRQSMGKIDTLLEAVNKSVKDICEMTSKTTDIISNESSAFSQIAASVQELSADAKFLEAMADKL